MADLIILFRFLEVIVCVWGFVYVFGYVTMAFEGITAFHALTLYPKRIVSAILLLILLAYMYGASYSYCVQHDMEIANKLVDEYVPNAENADYHGLYEALCESDVFFISETGAEPFAEKDILRCDAQNVFVTGFSDEMKSKIVSKLTKTEKEEFLHDIGMCDLISQGKISPEVNTWMEVVLAY